MNPTLRGFGHRLFNSGVPVQTASARSQAARQACARVNEDWQVTDLVSNATSGTNVLFTDEEVDDVALSLLGPAYRVDEPDEGSDADFAIQAAEENLSMAQLMPTLRNLLHNPEVQRACMSALQKDSNFRQVMRLGPAQSVLALEGPTQIQEVTDGNSGGLSQLVGDLGARLKDAGVAAMNTAVGLRTALGRFLIQCGASLHAVLGQPFSTAPVEEALKEEDSDERADAVGRAMITVAIAILSIVLLKRVHIVAPL